MPQRQPQPQLAEIQSDLGIAPECDSGRRQKPDEAREAALRRVCDGFTATISPRSAARLADLLSAASYAQAA
ncbi:hypothetical protein AB0I98_15975 [Streptomyces sp. NPDC050211]|uniref:hypothetical protein n=1 Tax=Streptomyces sp. NPDC050211 TaxID=3154932 RepID=UPI0034478EAB